MVEVTERSRRAQADIEMDPSPNSSRQPAGNIHGGRRPDLQNPACGHVGLYNSNNRHEPPFQLNGLQHARFLQAVLEQEQTGLAITDPDGTIQDANYALASLLLYQPEKLKGKLLEGLACPIKSARKVTRASQIECDTSIDVSELVRESAETISCHVESHTIRGLSGETTHFVIPVTDARSGSTASERTDFENGLFESQSLQVVGMLAAGIAHDFNNELEVIIGFAYLARIRLSVTDPLHEPLKIIEESALGAASLARQLLDVSKYKPDDECEIDVEDLINSVVAIITRTFDRNIRIKHRISPDLPRTKGIRNRLERALLNLCFNARDALQEGVWLTLEATAQALEAGDSRLPPRTEPGTYIRIVIRDSGIGVTPEIMEKIFDPLFTTKKATQGSGLGKILLVDDEPRILEFLEQGLSRLGYEVVSAERGKRACEIHSKHPSKISYILLDVIMLGTSGLKTYGRLWEINSGVRVILSSGYSSGRVRQDAVEAGSPEFLEQPYALGEISQALPKIQQN